jgi:hypothetical protein
MTTAPNANFFTVYAMKERFSRLSPAVPSLSDAP